MFAKFLTKLIMISALFSTWSMAVEIPALPANMSLSKALYINCLQRTQTQQLLKEYLMIGLKSSYKNPQKSLPESIIKYDKRLKGLDAFFQPRIKDPAVKQEIAAAIKAWKESKKLLEAAPSKENALILEKNFHQMVKGLGKYKVLSTKSFKAVGLAGGLCRDPLYITNTYLMKIWGVTNPNAVKDMEKRIAHFHKNISEMKKYKGNTDPVNKEIKKAEKAFQLFAMMYNSDTISIPTLLSKKADSIFVNIRTIKKLYGELIIK